MATLTLMKDAHPPITGTGVSYLCLIYSVTQECFYWQVDRWFRTGGWVVHRNVVAWMPLPEMPTKEQLEALCKHLVENNE